MLLIKKHLRLDLKLLNSIGSIHEFLWAMWLVLINSGRRSNMSPGGEPDNTGLGFFSTFTLTSNNHTTTPRLSIHDRGQGSLGAEGLCSSRHQLARCFLPRSSLNPLFTAAQQTLRPFTIATTKIWSWHLQSRHKQLPWLFLLKERHPLCDQMPTPTPLPTTCYMRHPARYATQHGSASPLLDL